MAVPGTVYFPAAQIVEVYMSSLAIDYRSYLRAELARRSTINPSYSLRAFARALSLAPGALSEILNGKRTLGPKKAMEITQKLALGPEERNWFLKSLERKVTVKESEENSGKVEVEGADFEIKGFIDAETWTIESDWLHKAIWCKLKYTPKKFDLDLLAKSFNVNVEKIRTAIERMAKKGFIRIHPEGELERVDRNVIANSPELADAARRINRDLLVKSIESIEQFNVDQRIIGYHCFSANSKKIKKAEEKIWEFRKELAAFLREGSSEEELDTVYCLTTTLFPMESKLKGE